MGKTKDKPACLIARTAQQDSKGQSDECNRADDRPGIIANIHIRILRGPASGFFRTVLPFLGTVLQFINSVFGLFLPILSFFGEIVFIHAVMIAGLFQTPRWGSTPIQPKHLCALQL